MYKYEVGQIIDNFKNHSECVFFDIADDGATMLVFLKQPTSQEIDQFKAEQAFEIRFTELYGIIMITVKIGNLNWMDTPYTPHLSKNLTRFPLPGQNEGLGMTLVLIDAITGEIKHIRLLGLSERFTKKLLGITMEQKMNEFFESDYYNSINRIYATYPTKQIVKLSKDYCKINV